MDYWLNRGKNLAKTAYGYYYPPVNTTTSLIGPEDNPQKYYIFNNQILGEGVFGAVYKGRENKPDGKNVVIKKLKSERGIDPEKAFQKEVECLKRIKEYCQTLEVICYEDAFEYKNTYYIITPLLEDYITLSDFLLYPEHKITMEMADEILQKLSFSLKHLHDNGIHHNDLHTGNIMIHPKFGITFEGDIQVKIIDFGLCTQTKPSKDFDFLAQIKTSKQHISETESLNQIKKYLYKKARDTSYQVKPLRKYGGILHVSQNLENYLVEDYAEHVRTSPKSERKSFQEYLLDELSSSPSTKETEVRRKSPKPSPPGTRRSPPGTSVKSKEGRKSPKRLPRRSPTGPRRSPTSTTLKSEGKKSPTPTSRRSPNSRSSLGSSSSSWSLI